MRGMREFQPHIGPSGISAGVYGGGARSGGSLLYPFERQFVSVRFDDQDDKMHDSDSFLVGNELDYCFSMIFRHDTDTNCLVTKYRRSSDNTNSIALYIEGNQYRYHHYAGGTLIKSFLFGAEVIGAWTGIAIVFRHGVTEVMTVYQDGVDVTAGADKSVADLSGTTTASAKQIRYSDSTGGHDDAQIDFQGLMYCQEIHSGAGASDYEAMPKAIWSGGRPENSDHHRNRGLGTSKIWQRLGFQSILKPATTPWENSGDIALAPAPDLARNDVGIDASDFVSEWPGKP